ncbi:MAG: hypothetical protein IMY67_11210 [Bacteroidetes bacterium]|nr:hypothetical protein [Bacteroidota bacterium]
MAKELTDLEILNQMSEEKKDIKCTTNLKEVRKLTQGGVIAMTVDEITIRNLQLGKNHKAVMYIVNKDEFNTIKKGK